MKQFPEMKEVHIQGTTMVHNLSEIFHNVSLPDQVLQGDFGLQIAADGRVWICLDGIAFIRFSPHLNGKMSRE